MAELEQFTLRLPPQAMATAQKLADESGVSRAEIIRTAVERGLSNLCEERNKVHVYLSTEAKRRNLVEAMLGNGTES